VHGLLTRNTGVLRCCKGCAVVWQVLRVLRPPQHAQHGRMCGATPKQGPKQAPFAASAVELWCVPHLASRDASNPRRTDACGMPCRSQVPSLDKPRDVM
jgi:hypothetical protein